MNIREVTLDTQDFHAARSDQTEMKLAVLSMLSRTYLYFTQLASFPGSPPLFLVRMPKGREVRSIIDPYTPEDMYTTFS